ncbi:MAG: recombinase family protein [SAR324 cluster bacterium]|nr:recombinase family protein [SAR324 cluster bacterium]
MESAKKTLVEHPAEYPFLQEILHRHHQGQSVRGILDWLNEERIPTKRKAWRWERMQVWRIVRAN